MMTTLDAPIDTIDLASENMAALVEAWREGDAAATRDYRVSDDFFGSESECAADALFVKRLALIVVPVVLALCLLTLLLAQFTA